MIDAFMFGTKTNEKKVFNEESGEWEYVTKASIVIVSPKKDALPYEFSKVKLGFAHEFDTPAEGLTRIELLKGAKTVLEGNIEEIDSQIRGLSGDGVKPEENFDFGANEQDAVAGD